MAIIYLHHQWVTVSLWVRVWVSENVLLRFFFFHFHFFFFVLFLFSIFFFRFFLKCRCLSFWMNCDWVERSRHLVVEVNNVVGVYVCVGVTVTVGEFLQVILKVLSGMVVWVVPLKRFWFHSRQWYILRNNKKKKKRKKKKFLPHHYCWFNKSDNDEFRKGQ